jgi:hypothetical protein
MGEVIQSLWIGHPLSIIERLSITSFLKNGHEYHLYCYGDMAVPAGALVKDASVILPESTIFSYQQGAGRGSVAAFSNLFRYKLLLEKGGWWVDTDVVCLRPFDFHWPALFSSEATHTGVKTASCVVKLPPGHAVAKMCYDVARRVNRAKLKWGEIGPDLVGRAVAKFDLHDLVKKPAVFCPVPWWEWRAVLAEDPQPALSALNEDTYAIHLWHEMWRRHLAQSPEILPTSMFAQLLKRFGMER